MGNQKFVPIIVVSLFAVSLAYIVDYGPVVKATKGAIWPKPNTQLSTANFNTVRPSVFAFDSIGSSCDILEKALVRYHQIINNQLKRVRSRSRNDSVDNKWRNVPEYAGHLDSMKVNLKTPCESLPYLGMDESYEIEISESEANLQSFTIWGILRGLESFSQLLYVAPDSRSLVINQTKISDEPRFSHRGLLVDTSRHFISMNTLEKILDGMAYNKLNVFHWHIVDDHSFPYESIRYPELSKNGSFDESMVYSQENVASVIEQARLRGIRVMAEFDTPGHTRSWGASHPELLTECGGPYEGKLGPINPIVDSNYEFIFNLFEEVVKVFPENFLHIGGDEVGFECWETNQEIIDYMNSFNITSYAALEEFYIQKVIDKVKTLKASSVVWQEVYTNGVKLPKGTVVHVWTGNQKKLLAKITHDKLPALLSTCWYLDHLLTGGDWVKFYDCDPHNFPGTEVQKSLVLGGEACMWGEVVDDANILQRIFPRASATAEKLWSQADADNIKEAMKRMEEHYCRMRLRNIPAQPPNGPGYCLY